MPVANAIELMTAWADSPDGPPDLLLDCLRRHIDDSPPEARLVAAVELIMSMTYLCGSMMIFIEEELGVSPSELLREFALHHAQP
jgi:hypothetical protein